MNAVQLNHQKERRIEKPPTFTKFNHLSVRATSLSPLDGGSRGNDERRDVALFGPTLARFDLCRLSPPPLWAQSHQFRSSFQD
jgi:hypothetical protein